MSPSTVPLLAESLGERAPSRRAGARRWTAGALWLAAAVVLLAGIGGRPVGRTQEARVLETARQMLGRPIERWLVPRVNDRLRLRKPPLAYWAAAAAYTAGGVSEAAGRVPTALAAWLTLAGTFAAGTWLFNRRAGLLAAAALLSSYLFFWHARLAETDPWATLFVTFGTLAFWRAIEPNPRAGAGLKPSGAAPAGVEAAGHEAAPELAPGVDAPRAHRPALWFHLGAACVALAALSKGAPALFPVLFLVGMALVRRRPRALWAFVRCGAPLTAAVPGLLWLGYASRHADLDQVAEEFSNNLRGQGHGAPFFLYFYLLPVAAVPWTGVMVVAIIEAARRWGRDPRLQGVLLWAASVMLPLFVTGNKQPHYLMMVMPCLMVLIGWALDEAIAWPGPAGAASPDTFTGTAPSAIAEPGAIAEFGVTVVPEARFAAGVRRIFTITVAVFAAAAVAAPLAARNLRGTVRAADVAVAAALGSAMVGVLLISRRRGTAAGVYAFAAAWAVALAVGNGWWWPTVEPNDTRVVATRLRQVAGDGPYCSYGAVAYLPLCFALRSEVSAAFTPEELRAQVAQQPGLHVLIRRRPREARLLPDAGFTKELELRNGDAIYELYRPASQAGPTPAPTSPSTRADSDSPAVAPAP